MMAVPRGNARATSSGQATRRLSVMKARTNGGAAPDGPLESWSARAAAASLVALVRQPSIVISMSEPLTTMADPVANLKDAEARLKAAAADHGRAPPDVLVVTKTVAPERILPLLEAGHRRFGENRVQEAVAKWPPLKARFPDVELHLIGPLQTNKARDAVAMFEVIQTLDRDKLARVLVEESALQRRAPRLYLQVNTGDEPQKAGAAPQSADVLLANSLRLGLAIEGLMCIPPADEPPAPHFALLAKIGRRNGLSRLSMGMSGDYLIAASLGATLVRIGSGIFGGRPA